MPAARKQGLKVGKCPTLFVDQPEAVGYTSPAFPPSANEGIGATTSGTDTVFPLLSFIAWGCRLNGGFAMLLQRGEVLGYDFDRMVVDFTMFNQGKTVRCAISTAAMDNLEGKHDVKADQRVDQFLRLRDAIEERASRKFFEGTVEAERPVVLRSNDFSK